MEKIIYGKYAVTDDGHVYSLDYNHTGKRKELVGYTDKDGYIIILIRGAPKEKIRRCRLVAECFIPNPDGLPMINHKTRTNSAMRHGILNGATIRIIKDMQAHMGHLTILNVVSHSIHLMETLLQPIRVLARPQGEQG